MRPFARDEGIHPGSGDFGDFAAGTSRDQTYFGNEFRAAWANVHGTTDDRPQYIGKMISISRPRATETDGKSLLIQERLGVLESYCPCEENVISPLRMDVEGKMGRIDGETGIHSDFQLLIKRSCDGLRTLPEHPVVNNQQPWPALGSRLDDRERCVNCGDDSSDVPAIRQLQAVHGSRIVWN